MASRSELAALLLAAAGCWLLVACTCVVNEAPTGRAVDSGAELDDSGAE